MRGHPITSWWKNKIMVTRKNIPVLKANINGLTLYKPEGLAEKVYSRDNIPIWFVIYHLW